MTNGVQGHDDWDDARIDAAFGTAFDAPAPRDLRDRILESVPRKPLARWWQGLPAIASPFAAASVLVAIVATTVLVNSMGPASTNGPSAPVASSRTTPSVPVAITEPRSAVTWPFPDVVASGGTRYDVVSVADAVRARESDAAPDAIAVRGWTTTGFWGDFCTIALPGLLGRLGNQCVYNTWLSDAEVPAGSWRQPPMSPAFRFVTAEGWPINGADIRFKGGNAPRGSDTAVVFVGHFHDAVAPECQKAIRPVCDATFVVTDVAWTLTAATFTSPPADAQIPAMTVDDAIAARDLGDTTAELAVEGWFTRNVVPCPQRPDAQIPLEACINDFTWLMRDPETLSQTNSDGSGSIHAPSGPALSLVLDGVEAPTSGALVYTLVIGHFRDPRAADCPKGDRRIACEKRFVVDILVTIGAPSSAPSRTP